MPERGRMRCNAEARGSRREMRVGFQSRKDKTACSCRLSPRSPRPRDVISTKKSVQNYKTGFLRRSTAVSSQGARAGERGRVRLAGTASPHLCPADARHDLKTGFCLRSPPRRPITAHSRTGFDRNTKKMLKYASLWNEIRAGDNPAVRQAVHEAIPGGSIVHHFVPEEECRMIYKKS